jgi:Protein of unknown function (DUF2997)
MTTIEITVSPKGETTIETRGFTGEACREASRFVEEALGRPTSERLTAAFYQGAEARNDLRQSS